MRRPLLTSIVLLAVVAMAAACTVKKTSAPALAGPSELGLSMSVTANPDMLTQDGSSQALIVVQALDAMGQPARNLPLRLEIVVNGVPADYGRLSARALSTGTDGRATATYTAPPAPLESVDTGTVVTIVATPTGTDYANATGRQVAIRLYPPGVIIPPNGTPKAMFSFSPSTPTAFTSVVFDASASTDDGTIVSYTWSFGDGTTGSGKVTSHAFAVAGEYVVTLTVTDDRGLAGSTSQTVRVSASTKPTADFVFSPTQPIVNQEIFFNAAASTAGPGRTLVAYDWNFGSGTPQRGLTVTKSYDVPGTYNVTLTVTDDAGQTATAAKAVTVTTSGTASPVAKFTYSPTSPKVGVPVNFNATESSSPAGIADYEWDFGDGTMGHGDRLQHTYTAAGTYVVRLTVTDNLGRRATTTMNVTVTV